MPGYKGHIAGGIVVFALLLLLLGSYCMSAHMALAWFIACIAGALFPDIDVKSKGQKYFYWVILALLAYASIRQQYDLLMVISIFSVVPMLVKHRGIFHEPWFLLSLTLSAWIILSTSMPHAAEFSCICLLFFLGGAYSHLFLDRGWKGLRMGSLLGLKSRRKYRR